MNIPKPNDWNLEITPTFSDVYTSLKSEKTLPKPKEHISKKKNVKKTFTKSFIKEYFKPLQHL